MKNYKTSHPLLAGVILVGVAALLSACAPNPAVMQDSVYGRYQQPYRPSPVTRPPVSRPPVVAKPAVPPVARSVPLPEQSPPTVEVLQVPDTAGVQGEADTVPRVPLRQSPSSAPVQILVQQASDEEAKGSLDKAEATIERALRIESDNPDLWLKLSDLKRRQGDTAQAEAMAAKAAYYQESLH